MAPLSDRESVALNYNNSNNNNNNKLGDISSISKCSVKENSSSYLSSLSPSSTSSTTFRVDRESSGSSSLIRQPQTHQREQVSERSDFCDENKKDRLNDKNDEKRDDKKEDRGKEDDNFEQPRRASSDAKTLKNKAKKISRCLSSNETRASLLQTQQHQLQPEKQKNVLMQQDKRSTNVKAATREAPQSTPLSKTNQSSVYPLEPNTNLAKNIKSKVSSSSAAAATAVQSLLDSTKQDNLKSIDINGSWPANRTTSAAQHRSSGSSGSSNQQKQMFSLKQLGLNSRGLTKKRCSLQGAPSNQDHSLTGNQVRKDCQDQTQISTSSSSSIELPNDKQQQQQQVRRNSKQERQTCDSGNDDDQAQYDELVGDKENILYVNENDIDDDELSDETFSDDDDDEDGDDDDDDDDDDDENSELSYMDGQDRIGTNSIDDDNPSRRVTELNGQIRDSKRKKRRTKRRQYLFRRSSCCNCEQLINKIDCDGLPVTDVDLVSYKDLCQMEQQAHHMRTSHGRQLLDTPLPGCASSTLSRTNYGWQSGSIRRSSLQEESGAYYELCTSSDEKLIRQKYVWFPPSLKQIHLVDKFFANFPKDKIPFASQGQKLQNISVMTNLSGKLESINQQQQQQQQQQQDVKTNNSQSKQETGAPTSLAASSYRDEQISSQLPRQDISLDYCSYPMSDSSRAAYMQFVDKRNSQALDVGNVVQVKLNFSQKSPNITHSNSSDNNQILSSHDNNNNNNKQFQRKVSSGSQLGVTLLSFNQNKNEQLQQHAVSGSGAQRCRRCLVRFEDEQLAIMAPNFVIGSTSIYRSSIIPSTSVVIEGQQSTNIAPLTGGLIQDKLRDKQVMERGRNSLSSSSSAAAVAAATVTPSSSATTATPNAANSTNVALFHPNCFTCSTCKEFLVDLVYCLRDNKLYCVRHYGESLRPRCSWCQELIFSDEYLKAMNESFHVDHFLCRHCDTNLAGQRYVLKEEKPFCIQCYEGNFANICEDCQKPIGIDSRDLSYKDRHWHDTCFSCNKCQQSLIDKPFGSKTDKVYCADCYDNTFATRCDGCKNPFRAGSKKMEYRGKQWHDSCFCCCVCQNTIGSNSFIPKNEEIYCIKCYEDKFATKCTKCKQVIVSGGVTFRNAPWHRDCFNCCNCNKSLAGQRFTTRDVKNETVKNINKTNQPHNAYCIDCYGELFAKKCFACTQAITGLGGTRFVTFEDRSWHNDCFLCNDCNTSLVGKGFITDGPETILCSDCARAKLR